MIPKLFDAIVKQDIDDLIAQARPERRTLEYKQALPNVGLEQEKAEFLADVCSFANASGGDILYGVTEKRENGQPTGIPDSAPGVRDSNLDAVILRLEQMARSNIDPKVPGFQMRPVPGFANGPVVIAHIPRSFVSPHMVRNEKGWGRFYARGSNGKNILDVAEIRSAFALSERLPELVRQFQAERLSRIAADETPVPLPAGPRAILHVLPLSSFSPNAPHVDVVRCKGAAIAPVFSPAPSSRFNLDGYVYESRLRPDSPALAYVQLFRSGHLEMVETETIYRGPEGQNYLPAQGLLRDSIKAIGAYLGLQRDLGVQPPIVILITLLGFKGYLIPHGHVPSIWQVPIDRDTVLLPDVLIQRFDESLANVLRPAFDALWQAAGWPRCFEYDEKGNLLIPTR